MALEAVSDWGASAPSVLSFGGTGRTGGSGPASLGAGAASFFVKINEVAPSDANGMDAAQIMNILHNLDTKGVSEAAAAHTALGEKLQQVADKLVRNAHTLAQSWKGSAAQAAMTKFQRMHTQTAQLAAQAKHTGQVLHWTAGVMEQFKNLPSPHGMSATQADEHTGASIGNAVGGVGGAVIGDGIGAIAGAIGIGGDGGQAKANAQARKYLHALNEQLVAANNALPATIGQSTRPWIGTVHMNGASGGTVGSGGGAASGAGLVPYSGAGGGSGTGSAAPAHIGKFSPASPSHGGAVPSASLQGFAPPAGGGTPAPPAAPGPVAGGPAGPANMPGLVPSGPIPNGGSGLASSRALAEEGELPAAETVAADGAAADGAAAEGSAGEGMAAEGMPMMPGMGAAGQASEAAAGESVLTPESLAETDPAFADAACGAGGAIGDAEAGAAEASAEGEGMFPMAGGAGAGQRNGERQRQAWMRADDDIWGVPEDNVGSVIDGK